MNGYLQLFLATGDPVFYLLHQWERGDHTGTTAV